ncbi:MAG: glycosyltransferase family 9 protein [Pseudomonadota bacterium]
MLVKGGTSLPREKGGILLIQLGDIGDVVLTMPTVRVLRQHFPENELIVCVREHAKELAEESPWVDGVISVNKGKRKILHEIAYQKDFINALRKPHFYFAIDLRTGSRGAIIAFISGATYRIGRFANDGRLWRNRLFTHLVRPENEESQYSAEHSLNIISPFGMNTEDIFPVLIVSETKRKKAEAILREAGLPLSTPIVAVHPFSLWRYKEWRPNEFVSLLNHITTRYGFSVIITGSPGERDRAKELMKRCNGRVFNLAGKTSIGELPAVLKACSLFVGVDTAALHMAGAVGVPTVGIFGPSSPINWAPKGNQHCVASKGMSCQPCRQKGCQGSEVSRCLEELKAEEVLSVMERQLQSIRHPVVNE